MSIIASNTSITHTFGNVACVAMNYIESYFGKDFFNVKHISTKMAYRQLDVFRSKKEFWKYNKPMLILRPRIEMDDSSKWFYGSTMMSRITNSKLPMAFENTIDYLESKEWGTMLRFAWNRLKITYDVVIIVETYNQQLNIAHGLINQLIPNAPFYIKTSLESYIPKNLVYPMAKHLGIPTNNTAEILKYMNTYSQTPVTYKFKNGSGTDEFFMLYDTDIETIVSDISIDDGEGKGVVQDTYTISFSMSMEFNAVGVWYLFLQNANPTYTVAAPDAGVIGPKKVEDGLPKERIVPILSIPLRYDLNLKEGWSIFSSPMYFIDANIAKGEYDETDLTQVLTVPLQETITGIVKHHKGMNIPLDTVIQFRCFKDNRELPMGKNGFEIDLDKFIIRTWDCSPRVTYRLFILTNNLLINGIASEITEFNKEK